MKTFRKFIVGLLISLIAVTVVAPGIQLASAQTGDISGNGGAVSCRNGPRDYGNFLSAVISYDGFAEYWKDIIERYNSNMCVYFDIDSLLKRINNARELIRKAFYTCDGSAPRLRQTYYELESELFFVRKFVSFSANSRIGFKSEQEMKNLFMAYTVDEKGFFTRNNGDAQKLFDKIYKKYLARVDAYVKCEDPTWGNLVAKWDEFVAHMKSGAGVKEAGKTIDKTWTDAVNTPINRTGNILGDVLDFKINGLEPEMTVVDIQNELEKSFPQGVTYEKLQGAIAQQKAIYKGDLQRTTYLAQYQQLYQDGSGRIVQEIIDRVTQLGKIIVNSFPLISNTAKCTKGLLDKTCG